MDSQQQEDSLPFLPEEVLKRARCQLTYIKAHHSYQQLAGILSAFEKDEVALSELSKYVRMGLPDGLSELRVLCWMLLLGVLPARKMMWEYQLKLHYSDYLKSSEMYYQDFFDRCGGKPLQQLKRMRQLQADLALYQQIQKDCVRTFAELSFFNKQTSHRPPPFDTRHRREKVHNINNAVEYMPKCFVFDQLGKILFIVAKLQPELSYSQGMNEVIAVLYYLVNEHRQKPNLSIPYAMFKAIAQRLRFYWKFNDEGIKKWLFKVNERLQKIDGETAGQLQELGIPPALYAIPWIVTLFVQTFQLWVVIKLWDYLLAGESLSDQVELASVSLIILRKETIMLEKYNDIIKALQNFKELDISELIMKAEEIKKKRQKKNPLADVLKGFQWFR